MLTIGSVAGRGDGHGEDGIHLVPEKHQQLAALGFLGGAVTFVLGN